MLLDVLHVRRDFPILRTGVVYLDSAASSLTPEPVLQKMLEKAGHEVIGFDLASPKTGEYTFMKGNIRNREAVKKATKGVDAVVHLAAYFTEEVIPNYWDGWDVNVTGTFNVLQASVENKVPKFIFASSISTTGVFCWTAPNPDLKYFPVDEKHLLRAQNLYGVSKIVGEHLCSLYSAKFDITTMCMRFACVWLDPGKVDYMKEIIEGIKNPPPRCARMHLLLISVLTYHS